MKSEVRERMERLVEKYMTAKATETGLIFGVPERWLRKPETLNPADQQRLLEVMVWE
jgi:hypothetical protein